MSTSILDTLARTSTSGPKPGIFDNSQRFSPQATEQSLEQALYLQCLAFTLPSGTPMKVIASTARRDYRQLTLCADQFRQFFRDCTLSLMGKEYWLADKLPAFPAPVSSQELDRKLANPTRKHLENFLARRIHTLTAAMCRWLHHLKAQAPFGQLHSEANTLFTVYSIRRARLRLTYGPLFSANWGTVWLSKLCTTIRYAHRLVPDQCVPVTQYKTRMPKIARDIVKLIPNWMRGAVTVTSGTLICRNEVGLGLTFQKVIPFGIYDPILHLGDFVIMGWV